MTTVFGRYEGTVIDAVISDSLRRACPTRFIGSDLSRSAHALRALAERHPSLPPMSAEGPAVARIFSRTPDQQLAIFGSLACRRHQGLQIPRELGALCSVLQDEDPIPAARRGGVDDAVQLLANGEVK